MKCLPVFQEAMQHSEVRICSISSVCSLGSLTHAKSSVKIFVLFLNNFSDTGVGFSSCSITRWLYYAEYFFLVHLYIFPSEYEGVIETYSIENTKP